MINNRMKLQCYFLLIFLLMPLTWACVASKIKQVSAIDLVVELVKKKGEGNTSFKLECLSFIEEEVNAEYTDIAIREKHNKACEGDPEISPIIERFRIEKKSNRILIYDAPEGEYRVLVE